MGALEEIDQAAVVAPVARIARSVANPRHALTTLDLAIASAIGEQGPAGPAYVDFSTDVLRAPVSPPYEGDVAYRPRRRAPRPQPAAVDEAAELIRASHRPLVIAGRAVRPEAELLRAFLERSGALCLDTRESKGAVPGDAPGFVPAVRGRAIAEADLVVTLARNLDFERLRIGRHLPAGRSLPARRSYVRRAGGQPSRGRGVCADVSAALAALVAVEAAPSDPDRAWRNRLIAENSAKTEGLDERLAGEVDGADGRMHPYSLLRRLNRYIDPDTVVVADGGDVLAFARVALRAPTYLDLGPFGCLGVGVPFANAAALARPGARVIAVIGDGAFGFNALEVETAVRERAPVLLVVVNNSAWNIERQHQIDHYDGRVIGTEPLAPPTPGSPRRLGRTGRRSRRSRRSNRRSTGRSRTSRPWST